MLTDPVVDPVVGLAWAAAHNPRVKLGNSMLLPGRKRIRPPAAVTPLVAPVPVTWPARLGRRPPQEPTAQPTWCRRRIYGLAVGRMSDGRPTRLSTNPHDLS